MSISTTPMDKGKEFLSQLKLYSDYLKWDIAPGTL